MMEMLGNFTVRRAPYPCFPLPTHLGMEIQGAILLPFHCCISAFARGGSPWIRNEIGSQRVAYGKRPSMNFNK